MIQMSNSKVKVAILYRYKSWNNEDSLTDGEHLAMYTKLKNQPNSYSWNIQPFLIPPLKAEDSIVHESCKESNKEHVQHHMNLIID